MAGRNKLPSLGPQVALSVLYFTYDSIYTSMLASLEWSKFAQHRKALRVTSPTHVQRSTYWLQLPYRYGIPLGIVSSILCWLVSQSLFLVRVAVYDQRGDHQPSIYSTEQQESSPLEPTSGSISTCGYSAPAIVVVFTLGTSMVLILLVTGYRKLDAGIPLVGSCSLAISAACHCPTGDTDAAFKPVKWGAVKHETDQGPGNCCFTTYNVEPPISGRRYAGYAASSRGGKWQE